MSAWQPISTMYRDGRPMIVQLPETGYPNAAWGRIRIAKWSAAAGVLTEMSGHKLREIVAWMPLPEPQK